MLIEYDAAKNARNIEMRGLSFELATLFDWENATVEPDTRKDYGEVRFRATGWIAGRLHVLVFTWRGGAARIISLRKANKREEKRYANLT